MGNRIYTKIEIGGSIERLLLAEFTECLCDDLENMNDVLGDDNIESFINDYFSCNGFAEWGSCRGTKKFCKGHNLSYREYTEADDGMEATVTFWQPGMEEDEEVYTDCNERPVIIADNIKPLTILYFDCVKNNTEGLKKHMDEPVLKDVINNCLHNPSKTLEIIENKIKDLFPPDVPDLPDFVITE